MNPSDRLQVDSAARHWDSSFQERASAEQRDSTYAMASRLFQKHYLNSHFAASEPNPVEGADWVGWVKRTLCPTRPFDHALVLGCGLGDGLVDFHRRGIASKLHGIDISATAIEHGRKSSVGAGLKESIRLEVGDFHDHALPECEYDAVFMIMSLHHALDLEKVLSNVRSAMKTGALFVANEYVGPDRWQYTWPQLLLLKLLLTAMPAALRRRADGSIKGRLGRPTLEFMMAMDPSEAAHSAAIPKQIEKHFELLHRIDYGCGVAVPVLDEIIGNFSEENAQSMKWLKRIVAIDSLAWRSGSLVSSNAILVGRRN